MHVHIGLVEFASTASYIIIFGFLWRSLAAYLATQPEGTTARAIGQGMSFIF